MMHHKPQVSVQHARVTAVRYNNVLPTLTDALVYTCSNKSYSLMYKLHL